MSNASKYAVSSKLTVVTLFKQSFSKGFLAWLTSTNDNASYVCEGNSAYNIYYPTWPTTRAKMVMMMMP